jgi:endoglucanase
MVSTCRRRVLLGLLVVGLLAVPGCYRPVPIEPTGFVRRAGRTIVDGTGRPLQLRGVNLGQWLMWEQWLMGAPFSQTGEKALVTNLRSLVGTARADGFVESLRDAFVTAEDLDAVAALGFNVVRVPINHTLLEDDASPAVYRPAGWARLDELMDRAERSRVYVVLDLHAAPCGQSRLFIADPDPVLLWSDAACQDRTVALWRAIAGRYASRAIVAGWDLLNEPETPRPATALAVLYRRIITAIRTVDRNHLVITEGGSFGTDFSMLTGALDANQAHSFHQYLWGTRDPEGDIARTKAIAARDALPLWLGEFGQDTPANVALLTNRFGTDTAISGWAIWTWKGTPGIGRSPEIRNFTVGPAWTRVIAWLDRPGSNPRPTDAEAEAGMQEYLDTVKLANTTAHEELIRALGPLTSPVR